MKCREVRKALVGYLDSEVMPSERTLIEAHLAGCGSCERELSALSSSRSRAVGSLKSMAAQAAPSPQAWSHLQARLTEEVRTPSGRLTQWVTRPAPDGRPASRFHRQGDHKMKLRWRIAFGTVGAVVLAAAVIAVVPTTRAAAGGFFANVFNIESSQPAELGYLPAGFEATPAFLTGSASMDAQGQAKQEDRSLYQNGDLFLLVTTSTDAGAALPEGEAATVNGRPAVLQTGLSGTAAGPAVPDADAPQGAAGAVSGGESGATSVSIEGGTAESATQAGGPSLQTAGSGPDLQPITYDDANSLTWVVDGKKVEILSNLPVDELLKVAEGLVLPN